MNCKWSFKDVGDKMLLYLIKLTFSRQTFNILNIKREEHK